MTPYILDAIVRCRAMLEADPDRLGIGAIPLGTKVLPEFLAHYPQYKEFLKVTNGPRFDVTLLLSAEELTSPTSQPDLFPHSGSEWLYIGSAFYIPIGIERSTQSVHIFGRSEGVHRRFESFDAFAERLFDGRYLEIVIVEGDEWSSFLVRNGFM